MTKAIAVSRALASGAAAALSVAGGAQAQDVAGFYGGLSLGIGNGTVDDWFCCPTDYDFGGLSGGAFAGYNFVQGDWVYGGELAYADHFDLDGEGNPIVSAYSLSRIVDLRGRLGKVFGSTLVYGALGYSWAHFGVEGGLSENVRGANLGLGFEAPLGARGFIGGDVTARDFSSGNFSTYLDSRPMTTVSIRTGFRF